MWSAVKPVQVYQALIRFSGYERYQLMMARPHALVCRSKLS